MVEVIRTDTWLVKEYDNPIKLCERIENFFPDTDALDIYQHLIMYGMYRSPLRKGRELIKQWQKMKLWTLMEKELYELQKAWEGPDTDVFILPADSENPILKKEQNGKSGLAFSDKLFLFISEENDIDEIRALLTHEYNHICRLNSYEKKEEEYELLDSVVLEGLAEVAVLERFGEDYMAKWAKLYSPERLEEMWSNFICPNRQLPRSDPDHHHLLYGKKGYPKMAGYAVSIYLVKRYKEKFNLSAKDMIGLPSSVIALLE